MNALLGVIGIDSPTYQNAHAETSQRNPFSAGLELYAARLDKAYSLTDCISMATMRREGLIEILTDDHHFEQEGFRALFRS